MADRRISIVIITRDRRGDLVEALGHLRELPERPHVIVVDNASEDGTPEAVRDGFPEVEVIALPENRGPAARNLGVDAAATPYVAFNDDDSWWAPGALSRAADLLDAHPRLALVNGHILVGPEERPDPVCVEMADSPLPLAPGQPGRALLSFIACAAVVRRDAFLAAGGFHERLGVGREEEVVGHRLALDGWQQSYVPEIVTHHHPSTDRDHRARSATEVRNALWTAWLTRPLHGAAPASLRGCPPPETTSATSPSSPTSTTARRRSSTPCSGSPAPSARTRTSPTACSTRWTSSARRASRSSPRTPPSSSATRRSTSSTRRGMRTSAARWSADSRWWTASCSS